MYLQYFQIAMYTMCLACDICSMAGISNKLGRLTRMKDFFFAVVGFPVAVVSTKCSCD